MKKLMIAAAIVCAAVASQAATMNWTTGMMIMNPKSATDGTFGSTMITTANALELSVFLFKDETTRDTFAGKAWASFQDGTLAAAADYQKAVKGTGAAGITTTTDVGTDWTADQNNPYYALAILTYDQDSTKPGAEWYIANAADGNVNGSGTGTGAANLAKWVGGGSSGTPITGWTAAAVPEPTSGLLLLLGVAGLALRRRRA